LDLIQEFLYPKRIEDEQENEEYAIHLIESGKYEYNDKVEWMEM
jgi:hypothetical protein